MVISLFASVASAQEVSFEDELAAARDAWFQGETAVAREGFQRLYTRLLTDDTIPIEIGGEVAVYLGEIAYEDGDLSSAEATWRWLLTRDPTYPISPYHHPLEVVGLFESVRSRIEDELAALPPPERRPYPWWGWAPFGVPQLAQRQPVRGATYLTLQAGLAATSLGLWVYLDNGNLTPGTPNANGHPYGWTDEQVTDKGLARKFRVQWPATFGFYTVWAISAIDGQGHWQKAHPLPTPTLGWTGDGPVLGVAGRF